MKATFLIPVELTLCCATCDHRDKRYTTEKRSLWERLTNDDYLFSEKTKKFYSADYCGLLNKDIAKVFGEEKIDMPCQGEKWRDTEEYFEVGFAVELKDASSVNSNKNTRSEQ